MRRFVNGDRFWEIGIDGKFVVTRHGHITGKAKEERRFCKDGAKAYLAERLAKRMAEPGWVEDRAEVRVALDVTPRVVGLTTALPFDRVPGPGPRGDADRPVGADLLRGRDGWVAAAAGLPEAVRTTLQALFDAAPAIGPLDPQSAAALLSVVPSREAADLVLGRLGLDGLVRTVIEGAWIVRDGTTARVGARTKGDVPSSLAGGAAPPVPSPNSARTPSETRSAEGPRPATPNWLMRGRVLSRSVDDADLAAAVRRARAAGEVDPPVDPWRLVDVAFLVPEAELGPVALARFRPSLPKASAHLAAALDPDGWAELARRLGADATGARWVNVAPWLPTLVARYGSAALAVPQVRDDLDLLRCIHHPDAARHLIGTLEKKGNDAKIAALTAMAPFTLQVLATDGARTTATKELARELAARPGLAEAVLPLLDAAGRRRLAGWTSVEAVPTAAELPEVLAGKPTQPLPKWLQLPKLPPLLTSDGGAAYPVAARARAIEQMRALPDTATRDNPLLAACDPASLGAFVLGLVDQYVVHAAIVQGDYDDVRERFWARRRDQEHGGDYDDDDGEGSYVRRPSWSAPPTEPEHETWVLRAAALCGDAGTARGLAQRVRIWPNVLWRLAADGVDVVIAIPDTSALVELGSLARRGPGAVRNRARLHLQKLARRLGLDEASLDEVLLPDLGLERDGTSTLDFGPRRFVVGFDAALEPFVRGDDGVVSASLPRPRKTDDPEKARAATEAWTALKKDVRTVSATLLQRLEDGLRRRRTWTARHFVETLIGHPFGRHVASRLLWSSGGRLFRVDEEGLPVDAEHEPVDLSAGVTLPHPVLLDAASLEAWGRVFADYLVVQPFEQLGRAVHRVDPAKDTGEWLPRLAGATFARGRLFALQQRGWRWVVPRDPDGVPGSLVALVADWAGGGLGTTPSDGEIVAHLTPVVPTDATVADVTVERVVCRGHRWAEADPVTFSEVVRDLG